jgi:hypothetical protein
MDSARDTACAVGCPIRRSGDQRALASPPGLSQRATSFIASQCQGIHQMPFSSPHTAPNTKHPVQITDIRSRISEPERRVPPDTATISPEDTSGRQTGPGRGAHASRHNPTPMPQASAASVITTRLFTLSINKPAPALRAAASGNIPTEVYPPPRMTSSCRVQITDRRWPERQIHKGSPLTVSSDIGSLISVF